MNPNIEKLLSMLNMEAIRVRESGDLQQIETLYLEIQRFIKTEYAKLEKLRIDIYLNNLNGQEEAEINGWLVTYKPSSRFALDTNKLKDYFVGQGFTEDEIKNTVYSHTLTKPTIKFKPLKK